MPKEIVTINQFGGGLNTANDSRDLSPNEFPELKGIDISGNNHTTTLTSMAEGSDFSGEPTFGDEIQGGFGLYGFSTDFEGFENAAQIVTGAAAGTVGAIIITCAASPVYRDQIVSHPTRLEANTRVISISAGSEGSATAFVVSKPILDDGSGAMSGTVLNLGSRPIATSYIASFSEDDSCVDITNATQDTLTTAVIDIGTGRNGKAVFYYQDNALRIADANFANLHTNVPGWRGYINRTFFRGSMVGGGSYVPEGYNISRWVTAPQELKHPGEYSDSSNGDSRLVNTDISGTNISTSAGDCKISLYASSANSDIENTLWEGVWDCAISFVYDDKQESLPHQIFNGTDQSGVAVANDEAVQIQCLVEGDVGNKFPERVSMIKVYVRKRGSVGFGTNSWYLAGRFDMEYGAAFTHRDTGGSYWGSDTSEHTHITNTGWMVEPIFVSTYEAENQHLPDDPTTGKVLTTVAASYKCVTIANRVAYIGNVFQDGIHNGDRLLKSAVNGFDKFVPYRQIDVSTNDGDEIVALASFMGKLLEFKQHKMHLINISEEFEYLEGSYEGYGVWGPAAVTTSGYGIFWACKTGVYFYDGQKIHNLLARESESKTLIRQHDWDGEIDEPIVWFDDSRKTLCIMDDVSSGGPSSGCVTWMYNMINKHWFQSSETAVTTHMKSNVIRDPRPFEEGVYTYGVKGSGSAILVHMKSIATPQAQTGLRLLTTAFYGESLMRRKKIVKVYITCKKTGTNKVYAYVKGTTYAATGGVADGEEIEYCKLGALNNTATAWKTQTFEMPTTDVAGTAVSFNNMITLQIFITDQNLPTVTNLEAPAYFGINDISIVYRRKSNK